ncbi:MAG: hypothetical protein IIZ46_04895 [Clostridia bacterium]|nr:hypothetical protein [Clostridia bacterium]
MRCEVCGEHIIGDVTACPYCSTVIRSKTLNDKENIVVTADKNFDIGHYTVSAEEQSEDGEVEDITKFAAQKSSGKKVRMVRSGDAFISAGGNNYNALSNEIDDHLENFEFGGNEDSDSKVQLDKKKISQAEKSTSFGIKIPADIKNKQYSFKDKKKVTLEKREEGDIYAIPDEPAVTFEQRSETVMLKSGNKTVRSSAHAIGHVPGGVVLPQGISRSEFIKIHQISDIRSAFYTCVMLMYFYALVSVVSTLLIFRHPLFLLDTVIVLLFAFFIQTRYNEKLSFYCLLYSFVDLGLAIFLARYSGLAYFIIALVTWFTLSSFEKLYKKYEETGIVMERRNRPK